SGYNPADWLQPKNRYLYTVSKSEQEEIEHHNAEIDRSVQPLEKQLAALRAPYEERLLEKKLQAIPEPIREETRIALRTPKEKQDEVQKFLDAKFRKILQVTPEEVQKSLSEADRAAVQKLTENIRTWNGYRRKLEKVQALWDVGRPPQIHLLERGNL